MVRSGVVSVQGQWAFYAGGREGVEKRRRGEGRRRTGKGKENKRKTCHITLSLYTTFFSSCCCLPLSLLFFLSLIPSSSYCFSFAFACMMETMPHHHLTIHHLPPLHFAHFTCIPPHTSGQTEPALPAHCTCTPPPALLASSLHTPASTPQTGHATCHPRSQWWSLLLTCRFCTLGGTWTDRLGVGLSSPSCCSFPPHHHLPWERRRAFPIAGVLWHFGLPGDSLRSYLWPSEAGVAFLLHSTIPFPQVEMGGTTTTTTTPPLPPATLYHHLPGGQGEHSPPPPHLPTYYPFSPTPTHPLPTYTHVEPNFPTLYLHTYLLLPPYFQTPLLHTHLHVLGGSYYTPTLCLALHTFFFLPLPGWWGGVGSAGPLPALLGTSTAGGSPYHRTTCTTTLLPCTISSTAHTAYTVLPPQPTYVPQTGASMNSKQAGNFLHCCVPATLLPASMPGVGWAWHSLHTCCLLPALPQTGTATYLHTFPILSAPALHWRYTHHIPTHLPAAIHLYLPTTTWICSLPCTGSFLTLLLLCLPTYLVLGSFWRGWRSLPHWTHFPAPHHSSYLPASHTTLLLTSTPAWVLPLYYTSFSTTVWAVLLPFSHYYSLPLFLPAAWISLTGVHTELCIFILGLDI